MFKWHHEFSVEIEVSITQAVNFFYDFNNWPKWIDQFESYQVEKRHENKTTVIGKVKNKNTYIPFLFTEIEPLKIYQTSIKAPFFSQVSTTRLQEVSPTKTQITMNATVTSFLTPFFKSYYRRKVEAQYPKMVKAILESVSEV